MKFHLTTVPATVAAALLCIPAVAQTRYCVGGDLDHLSAENRASCDATLQAVRSAATALHAPDGWHFVVVCGEDGWKQYTAFSVRGEDTLSEAAADTDLQDHTTYLREASLHTTQPHGLQRVVAHEVAGILLGTTDENAIEAQVASWERNSQTQEALLR
jgi:hypothetical protein